MSFAPNILPFEDAGLYIREKYLAKADIILSLIKAELLNEVDSEKELEMPNGDSVILRGRLTNIIERLGE
jgi:hypothetical protein